MSDCVTAYVGLGSNLGDREATLRRALDALDAREDVEVAAVSEFRETAPVGGPAQGPFINAVAALRTILSAHALLEALHQIEAGAGRERAVPWGPRTLDLDLLLYGDAVINTPRLQVPHPRMHQRVFVLQPLCDLAPHVVHPVLGRSAAQLLAEASAPDTPS